MLDKKKFRNELRKVYSYKTINDKKYSGILAMIEEYREIDPFFYNYQMGKFITTFGDSKDAISYLLEANCFDKEQKEKVEASIYYNLYKCYVNVGDYNEAFINLCNCSELVGEKGDFSLPLNMLTSLILMDIDFSEYVKTSCIVDKSNVIYFSEIKDLEYKNLYDLIIEHFNNRDFKSMLYVLEELKEKVDMNKYPIEVDSLVLLGKSLKENKDKHFAEAIATISCDDIDFYEYLKLVGDVLDTNGLVKRFFVEVEKYIDTDLDKAQAFYNLISSKGFSCYDVEMSYLKNSIKERNDYLNLSDAVKSEYEELKLAADKALKARDFLLAEEKYREAYRVSNLSVCEYYIGKALFKQGKFGEAKKHLNNYALNGGSKYDKCLLYLSSINNAFKKKGVARKQEDLMLRINDSFQKDFVFQRREKNKGKRGIDDSLFDRDKHNVSKHMEDGEIDFSSDKELQVSDFYDCNLDGKLSIIRDLYRHGQADVANHLLNELGPLSSKADKRKVEQFQRNKKLYKNQRRTY